MDYEEMQTETAEATVDTDVTTEVDLSAFDEGWDDDGLPSSIEDDYADEEEVNSDDADADQQDAEDTDASEATEETEQTENEKNEATTERFSLKHLDEVREVSRDEVITLAQKGMDYDRKVNKLNTKVAEYEEFLKELAGPNGLSIDQLIDNTRARMLRANLLDNGETITEEEALQRVQTAKADKAQAEAQAETKAPEPTAVQRFIEAYPDVKAESIPQSVWEEVQKTGDLLTAYIRHENAELKRKVAALETNKKNEQRSTGSRKTAGSGKTRDAFDEGWDSI